MGAVVHLPQPAKPGTGYIKGSGSVSLHCHSHQDTHNTPLQVEQCVHTLVLGLRPRPDAATACDKQLAASALRPKKLVFGNTSYTSAVLSSPKAVEVWQAVTAVEARHPLRGKTAMVGVNYAELMC
jgi:hypothetical protein